MYVLYDDQRQDEEAYGYRKTDPEHDRRRKESRFAIERISAAFFIDKKFRLGVFCSKAPQAYHAFLSTSVPDTISLTTKDAATSPRAFSGKLRIWSIRFPK